jgi:hypothetical protein
MNEILTTFEGWEHRLDTALGMAGSSASYRKMRVPFDWTQSAVLAEHVARDDFTVSMQLENLIATEPVYAIADFVCISLGVEDQVVAAFSLAHVVRKLFPTAKLVWGGNLVTRLDTSIPESALGKYIDAWLPGEGDERLVEYLRSASESTRPQVVGATPVVMGRRESKALSQPPVNWARFGVSGHFAPVQVTPLLASRRCYWGKCDFCAIYSSWDGGVRSRTVDDIVDELVLLSESGRNYVRFVDEDLPPSLMLKICAEVMRRQVDVQWEAYSRFEPTLLRPDVCARLFTAGCRQLFFGLENIGLETARIVQKGNFYTRDNITRVLHNTARAGILNYLFILVGIPSTPVAEEEATVEFVVDNSDIDAVALGSFVVDRMSPMHVEGAMHEKYGIRVFEMGDLTTEVGYAPVRPGDPSKEDGVDRASTYTRAIFEQRPDLAIASLLTEEQRFFLVATFGRQFTSEYLASIASSRRDELVAAGLQRSVEEKVERQLGSTS